MKACRRPPSGKDNAFKNAEYRFPSGDLYFFIYYWSDNGILHKYRFDYFCKLVIFTGNAKKYSCKAVKLMVILQHDACAITKIHRRERRN